MERMKGLVAIVTGASRGLGRAIAMEYAGEGASVAICARQASPTGLAGTALLMILLVISARRTLGVPSSRLH